MHGCLLDLKKTWSGQSESFRALERIHGGGNKCRGLLG